MEAVTLKKIKSLQESKILDYLCILTCFLVLCLEWTWAWGDRGPVNMFLGCITAVIALVFIVSPEYLLPPIFLAAILQGSCAIVIMSASRYLTLVFLFAQILHSILQKQVQRKRLLYIVILSVYFLFSALFSKSGLQADVGSILMDVFLMYFIAQLPSEKQNRIFRLLLYAGMLLSLYFFISLLTNHGVALIKGRYHLLWMTNANMAGRATSQMGLLFLGYCLYIRNSGNNPKLLVPFVFYLYSLHLTTLTGSRSALLGILGSLGILILLQIYLAHGASRRIRELGISAAAVCLSLLVVFVTPTILKSGTSVPANPGTSTPDTSNPAKPDASIPDTSKPAGPNASTSDTSKPAGPNTSTPDTSKPAEPDTPAITNPNLTPYGRLMGRLNIRSIIRSGGTGRIETWDILIHQAILPHPLFGIGFPQENTMSLLSENGSTVQKAHNIVISILSSLGLVGFLLLSVPFVKAVFSALRKVTAIPLLVIPLTLIFGALCNGIGEDIYTERFLWFSIGLCLWFLQLPAQEEELPNHSNVLPESKAES